jgi:hypothetical protein
MPRSFAICFSRLMTALSNRTVRFFHCMIILL